ncbi:MAG TPA: DUF1579 family protein [Candidatus Acidoferrales bacterium]|nr:DUF1579 family protein [Candidatus Acidoferrales bacterium]
MNRTMRQTLSRIAVTLAILAIATAANAQSAQNPPQSSQQEQDAVQQALIAAATPGPIHAQLMKRAGEYTTVTTLYATGAQPQQSTGTATLKSILDGRFLEETNSGDSLGQPYSGLRLYGYNNGSKQYEAAWIYTGSTAFLVLDGSTDDSGKIVRYSGAFLGPNGARQTLRVTVTQSDDDHFSVKLLGEGPDNTLTTLETVYTRVKKIPPPPAHR